MKKLVAALSVMITFSLNAQFAYRLDDSVPVMQNGEKLASAWSGGLNAAQYSVMDLNGDGIEDLVIFDRTAQKVITFLHDHGKYVYAPEYETLFPDEVTNFLLLRDFNGDGKKDIFTGSIFGIRVFKNVSTSSEIRWQPFFFYSGAARSEVLLTKGLSGRINMQLQFDDLPALADVDGDGDLDIFCMDYSGSGRVEFHRNFSMERYGHTDSLDFELITKSWGGFAECDCGDFAFNLENCAPAGGRVKHQGGKSLLAIDADGNGHLDLLLSEAECDQLSMLLNSGSVDAPVVSSSSRYPAVPAQFPLYPSAYFEDIDFDGVKDLIVSPNLFSKTDPSINFKSSNWAYKNVGSNTAPDFQLVTKSFLQDAMIDVGDNAVPAFADMDGDGDYDMFVSSNHYPSTITVYRNIGTRTSPEFELLTDDYLNLSGKLLSNMKIQLVDLNGDRTIDIVFTATLNGTPKLFMMRNPTQGKLDFNGVIPEEINFSYFTPENLFFTDVNGDGLIDILRGRNTGALEFWRNTGNLNFTLADAQFLGMGANAFRINPITFASDLDNDGKMDLLLADHTGQLRIISDYKTASGTSGAIADIVYNNSTEAYYAPNLGGRIWPVAVNLFNTSTPDLVVGTGLGGLRLLRSESGVNSASVFGIYPNPVRQNETLTIEVNKPGSFEIYTARGRKVQSATMLTQGENFFEVRSLAQGLYIIKLLMDQKSYSRRFVVH